ncbi:unnamed protein product [Closterium sp. Yama58-4]|nr:unnamed protein product [Closterium sp. Yama58-4]
MRMVHCIALASDGLKETIESRRKRGAWTAAEDAELSAYVAKYGAGNWKHVAEATALKRDAQSCRLRWSSHLDPKVNRAPFTPEEDARLLASVAWGSHGETKWAAIASAKFPSRTGYQIQSRWHSLVNKQRLWINAPRATSPGGGRSPAEGITSTAGATDAPPVAAQLGRSSAGGNTTAATDAPPVAAPHGRSAGNTSSATVTPPPAAAQERPARKTVMADALALDNRMDADQSTLGGADMLVRSDSGNGWLMKRAYNEAFEPEAAEAEADAADVAQAMLKAAARQGTGQGMLKGSAQQGMAQQGTAQGMLKGSAQQGMAQGMLKGSAQQGMAQGMLKGSAQQGMAQGMLKGSAQQGMAQGMLKGSAQQGMAQGMLKGSAQQGMAQGMLKGSAQQGMAQGMLKGSAQQGMAQGMLKGSAQQGMAQGMLKGSAQQGMAQGMLKGSAQQGTGSAEECDEDTNGWDRRLAKRAETATGVGSAEPTVEGAGMAEAAVTGLAEAAATGMAEPAATGMAEPAATGAAAPSAGVTTIGPAEASSAVDFLMMIQPLKTLKRTGWVKRGVQGPESIGDHMHRMSLMAFVLSGVQGIDRERCIKMAIVHDVAEATAGDITPSCGVGKEEKHRMERDALEKMCGALGPNRRAASECCSEVESAQGRCGCV